MAELIDLAVTAAGNTARFPENMQFRQVNDSARELEAMVARDLRDRNMSIAASGSSNAFAITTNQTIVGYYDNLVLGFTANHSITGAATLNVNGLGAKAITAQDGSALGRNDIVSGQKVLLVYRSSANSFQIVGGRVAGSSADVLARITPVGSIVAWPTGTVPGGWLECNGAAVSRTTYAELFAAIGTTYGAGDGSTTFNLPDYRGYFLRGHASGQSTDPDRATRTNRGDGTTGDNVGTVQGSQNAAHSHSSSLTVSGSTSSDGAHNHSVAETQSSIGVSNSSASVSVFNGNSTVSTSTNGTHTHTVTGTASGTTNSDGGSEARSINKYVKFLILALPAAASAAALGVGGLSYYFDTGTTDADPGSGKLRINNATIASATAIYLSETDGYGASLAGVIQSLSSGSKLYIYKVGAPQHYMAFAMGAVATDAGTYGKLLSLTHLGSNGSFAAGDGLVVVVMVAGATGATGTAGASGSDGGIRYTFDSSTTMADPGTGEFRLNSATPSAVTQLAISANTGESGNPDFSDWVTTWDDSTTTSDRGQIILRDVDGAAQAVYSVNGSVGDNGTWLQVPVSHIASTGTLSGLVLVTFSRTGNAGGGSGDVSAAANFSTDNVVIRSDGTLKGVQASGVSIDDTNNMSGIAALSATTMELGHASDTTFSRVAAGRAAIEGVNVVTVSSTDALSNKTISLGSNTVSGTTAQFNSALSDGDFATLAGTETLSNKTLTAPKIADLGFIADASGNEHIIFDTVASAVNEWTFANAATGTNPKLTASGGDANVGFDFQVKGAGVYRFLATASGPTDIRLFEDTDNGSNYASIIAPASIASNRVLTLPDATDTIVGKATTDTLTNKSIALGSNTLSGTTAQFNTALSDGDFATLAGTETLTNKSLTSPITTGTLDVQQALVLTGDITPTQITANQNDYAPTGFSTASVVRISSDAARDITGLAGGSDGRVIIIHNVGSFAITLRSESASSTAANRFGIPADLELLAAGGLVFVYDATASRWRLCGASPGATGGGGGDVTAAASFGTDNRAIRSDGTGKGVQSSGVTIDDSVNVSGIAALSTTSIELGHASDTTLARSAAGTVTIEGNTVITSAALATQADQETATSTTTFVSPGRQHYHPSAAKAWCKNSGSTTTINASYNVTSITDNGVGDSTISWNTDFSTANYSVQLSVIAANVYVSRIEAAAAGTAQAIVWDMSVVSQDPSNYCWAAYGDHA